MNQIQQLINQMCPNGVEWVNIGDVSYISDYVSAGSFASLRENVTYRTEPDYAVLVRIADFSSNFDESKFIYIDQHAYNFLSKSNLQPGDIIMSNVGSCGLTFRCPDLNKKMSLAPNAIVIRTSNNSFFYHWLTSKKGQSDIQRITTKSAMPKFNKTQFKQLQIPLPPLAIQTRIVEILDHFTNLTANLTAELNLRRKQFEHYREKLLSLDGVEGVEWKTLGEVGTFFNGVTGKSKKDFDNGNAKFISYMNVFSNPKLKIDVDDTIQINEGEKQNTLQYGDVIFTTSSETPDESGMSSVLTTHTDEKLYLNSFCFGFRFNNLEIISPDFYSYIFRSELLRNQIVKCANGVTRFNISKASFVKVKIPLPPLAIQTRIVEILDKFTALIENIEKELALRQKQYEYYREQLLNF